MRHETRPMEAPSSVPREQGTSHGHGSRPRPYTATTTKKSSRLRHYFSMLGSATGEVAMAGLPPPMKPCIKWSAWAFTQKGMAFSQMLSSGFRVTIMPSITCSF